MKQENMRMLAAGLCGLAAIVWGIITVLYGRAGAPVWLITLNGFCCALWAFACVVHIFRWKKGK